jgi:hypothetical protein
MATSSLSIKMGARFLGSMKLVITPNPVCASLCLKALKLAVRVALRGNGALVRLRCWLRSIKRLAVATGIKFPTYDAKQDGNVFAWIIEASEDLRKIRQRERYVELEKAAAKSESLDRSKVEN